MEIAKISVNRYDIARNAKHRGIFISSELWGRMRSFVTNNKGEKSEQRFKFCQHRRNLSQWIVVVSTVTSTGWDDVVGKRRFYTQPEDDSVARAVDTKRNCWQGNVKIEKRCREQ